MLKASNSVDYDPELLGEVPFVLTVTNTGTNYAPTFDYANIASITMDVGSTYSFYLSTVSDANVDDVHFIDAVVSGLSVVPDFITLD